MTRRHWLVLICLMTSGAALLCLAMAFASFADDGAGRCCEIVDMSGRTRVPIRPARVLSLCTSATDTMIRMGMGDRLAAIDEYGRIVPGTKSVPAIGAGSAISREQVIARGIDLAFVWWYQDDAAEMLDALGVPVVRIRSGRACEVPAMIRLVGEVLGEAKVADRLASTVSDYLTSVRYTAANGGEVYLELYSPYRTVGRDTYVNDLLKLAGVRNVAAEARGSVLLSAERLIQANPAVIFYVDEFTSAEAIAARTGLAACSAVRAGRVIPVKRYWLVAGAGLPRAVENLRRVVARAFEE